MKKNGAIHDQYSKFKLVECCRTEMYNMAADGRWLLQNRALLENHLVYTLYLEIVIFYSMHRYYENKQFQICSLVSTEKSMFI